MDRDRDRLLDHYFRTRRDKEKGERNHRILQSTRNSNRVLELEFAFVLPSNRILSMRKRSYTYTIRLIYTYIYFLYVEVGSRHSIPFDSFSFLFPLKSIHLLTELSNWLRKERKKKSGIFSRYSLRFESIDGYVT